jgi:hypothetical protein
VVSADRYCRPADDVPWFVGHYELSYCGERIVLWVHQTFVLACERLVKGSAVRQSRLAQQTRVSLNAPPQAGYRRKPRHRHAADL